MKILRIKGDRKRDREGDAHGWRDGNACLHERNDNKAKVPK